MVGFDVWADKAEYSLAVLLRVDPETDIPLGDGAQVFRFLLLRGVGALGLVLEVPLLGVVVQHGVDKTGLVRALDHLPTTAPHLVDQFHHVYLALCVEQLGTGVDADEGAGPADASAAVHHPRLLGLVTVLADRREHLNRAIGAVWDPVVGPGRVPEVL